MSSTTPQDHLYSAAYDAAVAGLPKPSIEGLNPTEVAATETGYLKGSHNKEEAARLFSNDPSGPYLTKMFHRDNKWRFANEPFTRRRG